MSEPLPDVLIIDDDDWVAQVLKLRLARAGYHSIRALDGVDALARLSRQPLPRLVTLDVLMPVVNGFNVLAEIRRREETRDLPVLVLSSLSGRQYVQRAIDDGATDYLAKPFRPDELVARVRRLLGDEAAAEPVRAV